MSAADSFGAGVAGDCLRLGLQFANINERELLDAVLALRDAVLASAHTSHETAVCRTQLAWWGEELQRVCQGEPRHPLSIQCHEQLPVTDDTRALFEEWTLLAEQILRGDQPSTFDGYRLHAFRRHGTTLRLVFGADDACIAAINSIALRLAMLNEATDANADASELQAPELKSQTQLPAGCPRALFIIHGLCEHAQRIIEQRRRAPSALQQLWLAWRLARRHTKATSSNKDSPS